MKIGYLGPEGTFSEEALVKFASALDYEATAYLTVYDIFQSVEKNEIDKGFVPIENSIEGSVNITLDLLAFSFDLKIEREIIYPIHHYLLGQEGQELSEVKTVVSHPQAIAQCEKFLRENLAQAKVEAASSTAEAALKAQELGLGAVAIGPERAAEIYNLKILRSRIEDFEDNLTRFVLVGKEETKPTGFDKTSIVCFIYEDKPGSLLGILQEFAHRYINLTKIVSRPTKKALGDYCFFIDMEGHKEDETIKDALKCLSCKLRKVKILGSYPRES